MGKIADILRSGKILVSDGAWGTFLQAKGLKPGECPELWNVEHPDIVFEIAQSYISAGSDMIETNSFGGSRLKLESYGLADRTFELNKAAAEISRKAAGDDHFVLGSVGPTGKILMMGEVTPEEMYQSFVEQCQGLAAGGVDAIVVETMTDLEEGKLAVKAAREHTDREVICTMTFEKTKNNDFRTMMGVAPREMVETMVDAGAEIIGANCGNGIRDMIDVVKEIRLVDRSIPILIHANAGVPVYRDGETVFPETPVEMASFIKSIIQAGVNAVGGCCGTTPEHIRKIVEVVR